MRFLAILYLIWIYDNSYRAFPLDSITYIYKKKGLIAVDIVFQILELKYLKSAYMPQ